MAPTLLVVALAVVCLPGCRTFTGYGIDPSGKHLFANRPPKEFKADPGCLYPRYDAYVKLCPERIVAPVGAEVIVLAGVCGTNGTLLAGETVEWSLPPGAVGHFVTTSPGGTFEEVFGNEDRPRKVDNTYLISRTSKKYITLTRGTPEPSDDVSVLRGQAWASVSSPIEGTSYVTALAKDVYGWDSRQRTATIDWVDARWYFPPASINPAGTQHTLTTTLVRASNQSPIVGWRVRYEISGGPPAGFGPDLVQVIEVPTDELGQANVTLNQQAPSPGTNNITVQVIRPAGMNGVGDRLVLAVGSTTKTWTAPQDLALRIAGPVEASLGSTVTYRIEVTNPGTVEARDVVVTDAAAQGLSFLGSNPAGQPSSGRTEWRLGSLAPGQTLAVDANYRVDREGGFQYCANARTSDGRTAQNCVTTTVQSGALDVQVTGPPQALVGEQVTFDVLITNRSGQAATGLLLVDRFDTGLQHEISGSPIERDLEDLGPGQSQRVQVTFRATQAGQQCNRVEARAGGGLRGTAEACVTVFEPQRGGPAQLAVKKTGPARAAVGETVLFNIDVTNLGQTPISNLKVADNYDPALQPVQATSGADSVGANIIWNLPSLPAGKTMRLQVECRCLQPAARTCNRVTVTADAGGRADGEACLEVGTTPAALELSVTDLRDPVETGKELTYEILVRNAGSTSDTNVAVVVTVPDQMTPLPVGTSGASGPGRFNIQGKQILFEPIAEVRAGERLRYQVRVRADRVGEIRLRVEVRSTRAPTPLVEEEATRIIGG